MAQIQTEISNWREFKEHFGMEKAKELSKKLLNEANTNDYVDFMVISYDIGFYATFSLVKRENNKLHYEFTGTAG